MANEQPVSEQQSNVTTTLPESKHTHYLSLIKVAAHGAALIGGAVLAGITAWQAFNGAPSGDIVGYATAAAALLTLASTGKPGQ